MLLIDMFVEIVTDGRCGNVVETNVFYISWSHCCVSTSVRSTTRCLWCVNKIAVVLIGFHHVIVSLTLWHFFLHFLWTAVCFASLLLVNLSLSHHISYLPLLLHHCHFQCHFQPSSLFTLPFQANTFSAPLRLSTSNVATYFRCGGIYYMGFVCNLLLFPTVKNWKSVRFWQSYHHQLSGPLFGTQLLFVVHT